MSPAVRTGQSWQEMQDLDTDIIKLANRNTSYHLVGVYSINSAY